MAAMRHFLNEGSETDSYGFPDVFFRFVGGAFNIGGYKINNLKPAQELSQNSLERNSLCLTKPKSTEASMLSILRHRWSPLEGVFRAVMIKKRGVLGQLRSDN